MPATRNRAMDGPMNPGMDLAPTDKPLERKYPADKGLDDWDKSPEEQDAAVETLRQALAERGQWDPAGPLDFSYLLRFLRARDYDHERALNMLLDHLQWRQEEGVDHILTDFNFSEREEFLSVYPQGYHKTDKLGHPVYIQHVGSVDLGRIKQVTDVDRMTKYHIQEYERCLEYIFPSVSKLHNRQIDKSFAIVDAKGIGLKHLTREVRETLGKIMAIDQNNYPETLYHTCVINAPSAFRMIWQILKPMLHPRTQAKVEVCPKNFLPALKEWIDEDCIPEYLGGKSKGTLVDDVGPWKDSAIIQEIEAERERRMRKSNSEPSLILGPTEMVQRQWSNLSNSTQYEDALQSPSFKESSPRHKAQDSVEFDEMKLVGEASSPASVPSIGSRSQALSTRIQKLELMFNEQANRLQPYLSRRSFPKPTMQDSSTLLGRVEVLERGMDLLLRAQEDALVKESAKGPPTRGCSCCSIM